MKKLIVMASIALCSLWTPAFAAKTFRGKVTVAPRRGPAPNLAETLVWLEPLNNARPRKPESVKILTHSKTLSPHVLAVPVGSTVQFPNDDPILHNLFSISAPNNFDLGLYRRNAGKSQRFDSSGVVNIYCNVHPSMSAVLHVMSTPYYGFADESGDFDLGEIPAGKYRLNAWNETGGTTQTPLEVTSSGEVRGTTAVTLDGRRVGTQQHLNKFGRPYSRSNANEY